jgi:hypothetical protein
MTRTIRTPRFLELTEDTWRAYGKPMFIAWEDIGVDDKKRLLEATRGHELTAQAFEREAADLYQIITLADTSDYWKK